MPVGFIGVSLSEHYTFESMTRDNFIYFMHVFFITPYVFLAPLGECKYKWSRLHFLGSTILMTVAYCIIGLISFTMNVMPEIFYCCSPVSRQLLLNDTDLNYCVPAK